MTTYLARGCAPGDANDEGSLLKGAVDLMATAIRCPGAHLDDQVIFAQTIATLGQVHAAGGGGRGRASGAGGCHVIFVVEKSCANFPIQSKP